MLPFKILGSKTLSINFEKVWKETRGSLKRFIAKRVPNEHDAEDILQDVFCKIYKDINKLNNEDRFQAWSYKITRNAIVDYYRHQNKQLRSSVLPETLADEFAIAHFDDKDFSWVRLMVADLPEKYRQVILLTEIEGLTQRETAEKLGLSLPGTKSRIRRAREKLKEFLLQCCHFEFDRLGNIVDYQPKEVCRYCSE